MQDVSPNVLACGVVVVAMVTTCVGLKDPSGPTSSEGSSATAATSDTGMSQSGSQASSDVTATTGSTGDCKIDLGSIMDGLPCSPEQNYDGYLCIPRGERESCGACCGACAYSEHARKLVDELYGAGLCLDWVMSTLCGPAEIGVDCCYVVRVTDCLLGDS